MKALLVLLFLSQVDAQGFNDAVKACLLRISEACFANNEEESCEEETECWEVCWWWCVGGGVLGYVACVGVQCLLLSLDVYPLDCIHYTLFAKNHECWCLLEKEEREAICDIHPCHDECDDTCDTRCFARDSIVTVQGKGRIAISDLKVC